MNRFADWGNALYSGRISYPFIQRWRRWFALAALLLVLAGGLTALRGGFNLGIEFRGGSEFTVSQTASTDVAAGERAVTDVLADGHATVTNVAPGTVRVQTEQLDDAQTRAVAANLQEAYGVGQDQVTSTFVGPTWGAAVSQQALIGLVIFVVLVTLFMAVYFRTWKMSLAAVLGMLYVVALTAGIYGATGFEITPSAIIGFLTILSYALYDTVVVFDKIRENTIGAEEDPERSFVENVNLAVNQTLVRSITAGRLDPVHRRGAARCRHAAGHRARAVRGHHRGHPVHPVPPGAAVRPAAPQRPGRARPRRPGRGPRRPGACLRGGHRSRRRPLGRRRATLTEPLRPRCTCHRARRSFWGGAGRARVDSPIIPAGAVGAARVRRRGP